jgi:dienelactone hydrolase
LGVALSLGLGISQGAARPTPAPAIPSAGANWTAAAEAPALARLGQFRVGTNEIAVDIPQRPGLGAEGLQFASAALPLRLFFPASVGGRPAIYRHVIHLPLASDISLAEKGVAFEGAQPLMDRKFPLVVVSHGFGGWNTHLSRLCEVIASHGYVVAAVSHGDSTYSDVPGFFASFGQVLLARPVDQRTLIASLLAKVGQGPGAMASVDPAQPIGLIGYSMGGYGALGTAGADYDQAASPYAAMPAALRQGLTVPSPVAGKIGALVALAPWGGQPESRVWTAASLGRIAAPTLLIDGDHDDVVNYRQGVRWIYDNLSGTNRRLLTLRQAKHNIAGNHVELPLAATVDQIGYFREPVWRQERLNQVGAHFIVAFLDENLKTDKAASAFLDVPTVESDAGEWPIKFGEQTGGTLAGDGQPKYWRGFPRGWAIGMAMERKARGE